MFLDFLWPLTFDCPQSRSTSDSQPPETSTQNAGSAASDSDVQPSPLADGEPEVPFTEVHTQLAPTKQQEMEEEDLAKEIEEEKKEEEEEIGGREEGVAEEYALSSTLRVEEKEEEKQAEES